MPKSGRPKKNHLQKQVMMSLHLLFLSLLLLLLLAQLGKEKEENIPRLLKKKKKIKNLQKRQQNLLLLLLWIAYLTYFSLPFLQSNTYKKALESLTQAYKGLKEEEKEEKHQVKQLECYTQSILTGGKPFIYGKEQAVDVLRGVAEEVKALCKEIAPIKETYAERLKKDLPSLSSLPSSLLPPPPSAPSPSSRSSISTRSKKKQLQKRKLVLITDEKDQPLDTFSIQNKVNISKLLGCQDPGGLLTGF